MSGDWGFEDGMTDVGKVILVLTELFYRHMVEFKPYPISQTREEANRHLLGVLLANRGMQFERAVAYPHLLAERAGTEDIIEWCLAAGEDTIFEYISVRPGLVRMPREMARNTYACAVRLEELFDSDARNIWFPPQSAAELRLRFLGFRGIGSKIADLGVRLAALSWAAPLTDGLSEINVAVDRHMRRVFERLELVEVGASVQEIQAMARRLSPDAPCHLEGGFELALSYCFASLPLCGKCPLSEFCPSSGRVQVETLIAAFGSKKF